MYSHELEQVKMLGFLDMWIDSKLTFGIHIQKLTDKCKKGIHVMRCLVGVEWGASRPSLRRIYSSLIRQTQALRISRGAFRTSIQVEMGEMPLEVRRRKLKGNSAGGDINMY